MAHVMAPFVRAAHLHVHYTYSYIYTYIYTYTYSYSYIYTVSCQVHLHLRLHPTVDPTMGVRRPIVDRPCTYTSTDRLIGERP